MACSDSFKHSWSQMSDEVWKEELWLFKNKSGVLIRMTMLLKQSERFLPANPGHGVLCWFAALNNGGGSPGETSSTFISILKGGVCASEARVLWAFISRLNGWDCPCVLGWMDVISKACNSFQEGRGRIQLEIFFYSRRKIKYNWKCFQENVFIFQCFPRALWSQYITGLC